MGAGMSDEEIGRVFDDNYVARTKLRRFHVMMDEAIALYETPKALSDRVTGREIAALLRLLKEILHDVH